MDAVEEYKSADGSVMLKIYQDDLGESPREWDNLGTMVCWHRRYNLGDKHSYSDPDSFMEWWKKQKGILLPLYLYDHSGITMSTSNARYPFNDRWDSGQVGWTYITNEKIRKEYSAKKISKKLRERVAQYLINEVETYDQYLTGDVYGFKLIVEKEECQVFEDSCWGFYGSNVKENGILDSIPKEYADQLQI
jgi:hypothetical protein